MPARLNQPAISRVFCTYLKPCVLKENVKIAFFQIEGLIMIESITCFVDKGNQALIIMKILLRIVDNSIISAYDMMKYVF
jgi:hypothetical protein